MPLPQDIESDKLIVELSFNTSDATVGLPPGSASPLISSFEISGIFQFFSSYLSLHVLLFRYQMILGHFDSMQYLYHSIIFVSSSWCYSSYQVCIPVQPWLHSVIFLLLWH